ncbi:MAG: Stress-induced bacterial acidophilic repeat motif [Rickettsiaceae bacterium]|nr:Stress-induced bacterial acidophilic repeat motif [Rickettsiaceae bacterium]
MSNKDKGFASMDKDKVREIAAKGGHESHKNTSSKDSDNINQERNIDSKNANNKNKNDDE